MKINGPGGVDRSNQVYARRIAERLKAAGVTGSDEADSVEISDIGKALSALRRLPAVREEKVQALRREIERGEYDVESRIDDILDDILEDIGVPPSSVSGG